jgi:hypothetical protein
MISLVDPPAGVWASSTGSLSCGALRNCYYYYYYYYYYY